MKLLTDFQAALTKATLRVARDAAAEHASQRVYSFALYTSGEYSYVTSSLSTEEGLNSVAGRYIQKEPYRSKWDIEIASKELRWSPCDSPHHDQHAEAFDECNALLNDLWESIDVESEEGATNLAEAIHSAFLGSLVTLRDKSIFEPAVVLNLLKGDQSDEEKLYNSSIANWPSTHARYAAEVEAAQQSAPGDGFAAPER